jgi:hypothetical protein
MKEVLGTDMWRITVLRPIVVALLTAVVLYLLSLMYANVLIGAMEPLIDAPIATCLSSWTL